MDYAKEYTRLHEQYPKFFAGFTIKNSVNSIAKLVEKHKPKTMLDYGSGKGYQYLLNRVHERWGGLLPVCYDVGVRQLARRPEGQFDAVICTDMMEHIEEKDVPAILKDIGSFVTPRGFVFFAICTIPEHRDVKKLSDGRGVHVCVRPPEWWGAQLKAAFEGAQFSYYVEYSK